MTHHLRLTRRKSALSVGVLLVAAGASAAIASAAGLGTSVPNRGRPANAHPRGGGAPIVIGVQDYSFAIDQATGVGSGSSGAGAGKVTLSPLSVTTRPGTQTPALLRALGDGSVFPSAELIVPGPGGRIRLDVKFRLGVPTHVHEYVSTGGAGGFRAEDITFEYAALPAVQTPVGPTGG